MDGKPIVAILGVAVVGYAAYKLLGSESDDSDSQSFIDSASNVFENLDYNYNPFSTKNPSNIVSALQQMQCAADEVYMPNMHKCVKEGGSGTYGPPITWDLPFTWPYRTYTALRDWWPL